MSKGLILLNIKGQRLDVTRSAKMPRSGLRAFYQRFPINLQGELLLAVVIDEQQRILGHSHDSKSDFALVPFTSVSEHSCSGLPAVSYRSQQVSQMESRAGRSHHRSLVTDQRMFVSISSLSN